MLSICEWLEETAIATLIRESTWGFAILVTIHIMALGLSAGVVFWFDLRLLSATLLRWPVSTLYRRLAPWMLSGFLVMFVSGGLLLTAHATKAYVNVFFWIKASALMLAGVNALVFHFVTERQIERWDKGQTPVSARLAGLTSILIWTIVILAGRMMSYTMYT